MEKVEKRKRNRQSRRQARAETYFWMYYQLGPDRSLQKLYEMVATLGPERSLKTLKKYSADFGWQQRITEVDAKLQAERENTHLVTIEEMNERQATGGRNLQALATAGMLNYRKKITKDGLLELSTADLTNLYEKGVKIERLARGEATDRKEAAILCYNVMLLGFMDIVKRNNTITNPMKRLAKIASEIDQYRESKLIELTG